MIAEKREVAIPGEMGFPWSECQVYETDGKSLYKFRVSSVKWDGYVFLIKDTHGYVYSRRLPYREYG